MDQQMTIDDFPLKQGCRNSTTYEHRREFPVVISGEPCEFASRTDAFHKLTKFALQFTHGDRAVNDVSEHGEFTRSIRFNQRQHPLPQILTPAERQQVPFVAMCPDITE